MDDNLLPNAESFHALINARCHENTLVTNILNFMSSRQTLVFSHEPLSAFVSTYISMKPSILRHLSKYDRVFSLVFFQISCQKYYGLAKIKIMLFFGRPYQKEIEYVLV